MNPTNFYNKLNNSGYMPNITNNINIKNVNIINSNEPFNYGNKLPFFNSINVNNDLNNNIINNNYYRQNQNINFSGEIENNNKINELINDNKKNY